MKVIIQAEAAMAGTINQSQIETLSRKERLELIELLWESLTPAEKQWPLSAAQRAFIKERLAQFRANPRQGEDYRVVLKRLRKPKK